MKMFSNENLKEKTFSVTCDNSQPDNYIFTWNDGEVKPFVIVPYTGAIVLSKHFNSIDYACSNFSVDCIKKHFPSPAFEEQQSYLLIQDRKYKKTRMLAGDIK